QGFIDAWRIGAERYASWKAEGRLATWDVAESQARYEPSDAPGRHTLPAFDDSVVSRHVAADASRLEGLRREFMATHFDEARRRLEITPSALAQMAQINLLAGRADSARALLERALERAPQSPALHNDLAVVLVAQGDVPHALEHLDAALTTSHDDGGV